MEHNDAEIVQLQILVQPVEQRTERRYIEEAEMMYDIIDYVIPILCVRSKRSSLHRAQTLSYTSSSTSGG